MSADAEAGSAPERTQIVIAGGGPAGLAMANLLGSLGVRAILLERNASTVHEPRAVSIDDESFRTLQMIGLAERAIRDVAPGYGSIYLGPNRKPFAFVHPTSRPFHWNKRNAFNQPLLENLLRQGAEARPGIDLRFEAEVLEHEDRGGDVRVRVRQGGRTTDIVCDYLVGCDGGRSRTRRAIGATLGGSSFEEKWLIIDTVNTADPFRETRVFCDPYRPGLSLPGPDRRRRYEIRLRDGETVEEMETEAKARELIDWYGGDATCIIERRVVYNFQARIVDHWRAGRVFLCGDAAHLTPPFAGQGMNAGMRDVSNLAWKLAAVLQGRLGAGLLDSYEPERREHAWSMIMLAVNMGHVMSPRSALLAASTRAMFRVLSLVPRARDYVAEMRYKPRPRFSQGFILPGGGAPGTMFPQPDMEVAAGDVRRLDDLLGNGFACLVYSADPAKLWARVGPALPDVMAEYALGVLPEYYAFPPTPFAPLVRDHTGAIGRFLGDMKEAVVVLRPERYVAAVIDQENIGACSDLRSMVAATWKA